MATVAPVQHKSILDQKLAGRKKNPLALAAFLLAVVGTVIYIVLQLQHDLQGARQASIFPYVLLGIALLIALGFEFVNGFHDTANAVATVIYTHSLEPHVAVVWSGLWNFLGVLTSSGAVAFGIVALLPVELILKVSAGRGFAMVFALLVAAVLWNLGTWWRGLPVSSSHTMIGSILGVGLMNQWMNGSTGTSGLDWTQVTKVFKALLFSPIIGFVMAALLFLLFKLVARDPRLYKAPEGNEPPPFYIRALLVLTCTGVSFAHGSNDGQKGMGLIMLILVGTVPTAYALNHAVGDQEIQNFLNNSDAVVRSLDHYATPGGSVGDPALAVEHFVSSKKVESDTVLGLQQLIVSIRNEVGGYHNFKNVPQNMQANVRNQMYLASEGLRFLPKGGLKISPDDQKQFDNFKSKGLDRATKFIPVWVKVSVALALGLGTMVGWKRIVITVGEKIGKTHLTYAQGASAELVAMATIWGADSLGLPVSTTHVLSSGVAGTMAANGSGLQRSTLLNIAAAWVFTLPAAAVLSAGLFWAFTKIAG